MKMAMGWLHLLILVSETLSKRDCLQLGIYSFFTISVSCFVYILFVLCCKRWYISKRKLANLRSYLFTRINIYIFFFFERFERLDRSTNTWCHLIIVTWKMKYHWYTRDMYPFIVLSVGACPPGQSRKLVCTLVCALLARLACMISFRFE